MITKVILLNEQYMQYKTPFFDQMLLPQSYAGCQSSHNASDLFIYIEYICNIKYFIGVINLV